MSFICSLLHQRDLSTVVSDKLEGFLQYLVEKKNQKNIIGIYER